MMTVARRYPLIRSLTSYLEQKTTILLVILLVLLTVLAWSNRFLQDDAFISYRYADRLAHGHGLTWNDGERIEGYSNFLWVLLLSGAISVGLSPVSTSTALGLCAFVISLLYTYKLAEEILRSRTLAIGAVVLLGTNYTFSSYATGGLETQCVTALGVLIAYCYFDSVTMNHWAIPRLVAIGLLATAMALTRLDSLIVGGLILMLTVISFSKHSANRQHLAAGLLYLIGPMILIIGCWFGWKLSYYGTILPNSFSAKASHAFNVLNGLKYLYRFTVSYLLFPFVLMGLLSSRALMRREHAYLWPIALVSICWLVYVACVGGDFMEFRFMVPMLPFLFILIMWMICWYIRNKVICTAFLLLLPLGSVHHAMTFSYVSSDGIESIQQLRNHLTATDEQWSRIGQILGETFASSPNVIIATTAAGAIPYYSHLTTIDMLGINDPWVVEHGVHFEETPGHTHIATLKYLLERNVHLVIAHPLLLEILEPITKLPIPPDETEVNLSHAAILEIPVDDHYRLIVLYLMRSEDVDRAIEAHHWRIHVLAKR